MMGTFRSAHGWRGEAKRTWKPREARLTIFIVFAIATVDQNLKAETTVRGNEAKEVVIVVD